MKYVKSHRRVELDETGQASQVENTVLAENILNAGDLPENGVDGEGVAVLVGVDGKLRRTTVAALTAWLLANIQSNYSVNVPYINDENGHWMTYDATQGGYVDTGRAAQGAAGAAAGFGAITASVGEDDGTGVPSVSVTTTGPDTAKDLAFAFKNIKGEPGPRGEPGPAGEDGAKNALPLTGPADVIDAVDDADELAVWDQSDSGKVKKTTWVKLKEALSNLFAEKSHDHVASDITNGVVSVCCGGTGLSSMTAGYLPWGNENGPVIMRSPDVSRGCLGIGYGTCANNAEDTAKEVTFSDFSVLSDGARVAVRFIRAVPASATLNVNSTGAKAIYYRGTAIKDGVISAGAVAEFVYGEGHWHLVTDVGALPKAGGDLTGTLYMNNNVITGLKAPTAPTDAVNTAFLLRMMNSTGVSVSYAIAKGDTILAGGIIRATLELVSYAGVFRYKFSNAIITIPNGNPGSTVTVTLTIHNARLYGNWSDPDLWTLAVDGVDTRGYAGTNGNDVDIWYNNVDAGARLTLDGYVTLEVI